jgi:hypothetical protein
MRELAKLPEKVKTKWLEALRSGKYTQTTEILQDDCGYCCLGVLCKVAAEEGVDLGTCDNGILNGAELSIDQYDIYEWSGLNNYTEKRLMRLNDEKGQSFDDIADFIEEYL